MLCRTCQHMTSVRLLGSCRGKWATASAEEVQAAKDAGIPYCYRFRSPKVSMLSGVGAHAHAAGSFSGRDALQKLSHNLMRRTRRSPSTTRCAAR